MPTIRYCDYTSGNDSTGDGSAGNPYKTITTASTGLTGGDEVRVAKSPANTALTGTLTFTAGSTTLTGSSTLFTTELAVGDFVKGNDNHWYEVVTITSATAATLYQKYPSTTASGVSSYKLGVTSTGAAAASTTVIQSVAASGSSVSSLLKISGGWNLSGTPAIDGETWFRQMHGTFGNRYGYGLQVSSKNYIELDGVNFLRYNRALDIVSSTYITVTTGTFNSNSSGIFYNNSNNNTITTATCNSNSGQGINYTSSNNNTIESATCNSNTNYGINYTTSHSNIVTAADCKYNSYGVQLTNSGNNLIGTITCDSNSGQGINYAGGASNNIIADLTANSNTTNAFNAAGVNISNIVHKLTGTGNIALTKSSALFSQFPIVTIQDNNGGGSKNYFSGGETYSDTTDARSGTCLKYDVNSATDWMTHVFKMKVALSTAYTVTFYVKKDVSFSGDIEATIYNMGKEVVAYADKEPTGTGSYEAKTISIGTSDIIAAGIAELRIRARGTAGNCFVDDISIA